MPFDDADVLYVSVYSTHRIFFAIWTNENHNLSRPGYYTSYSRKCRRQRRAMVEPKCEARRDSELLVPVTMCGKSVNPPQLQVSSQLQRFPWATAGSFCTLLRIEGNRRSHASQAESCVVFIVCSASDGVLSHIYIVFAFQGVESV